jgi:hypothetical protein
MITITLTPSDKEIISGIPQTLQIDTSTISTIYYTLDGTIPTPLSLVYIDPIYLPTDSGRIVVSIIAYYSDGYSIVPSSILTQIYETDVSAITRARYVFFEGIVYSYPGGSDIPLYYDYAGNPTFYIDIPLDQLEMILSETDSTGAPVDIDNKVDILGPEFTGSIIDDGPPMYSSANDPDGFRPDAMLIVVDGRASAENRPSVDIINGHMMSLRNSRSSWSGIDYLNLGKTNYLSGSATKYQLDRDKNIIVFYYFDSNSCRWVKSIQDLPPAPVSTLTPRFTNPHVMQWFPYGRHQR